MDIVTAVLLLVGSGFVFIAGIGIVRMPDLLIRMHASTKAGTLGCGLILVATALHFQDVAVASRAIAAFLFLLITAPVAAHLIGRAAYRAGIRLWEGTVIDEWARDRAEQRARGGPPDTAAPASPRPGEEPG